MVIPSNCLVPRITQRLNYVLWVEDLLQNFETKSLRGIDIGCGASCVFSLIACSMNKNWKMIASEIDDTNFEYASENVKINRLEDRIEGFKVENIFNLK